jgi:hypothetical protein
LSLAVLERWERRLQNWSLWCVRGSSTSSHISGIYRGDDRFRGDYVGPQPLAGDALDVDGLVARLDEKHGDALRAAYIWTGTVAMCAADLRIHPNTLRARVIAAKFRLEDLDQARRARMRR